MIEQRINVHMYLYIGLIVLFLPDGYVMLMRPNKAETAVHGCHSPGDMALRRYWPDLGLVFECVTCFYHLFTWRSLNHLIITHISLQE